MPIKTTDADYWALADGIYEDEQLTPGQEFDTAKSVSNPTQDIKENHKWVTVTSINDKNSDLQAAMVVPADEYDAVVKYHQQPSQAIFVARGTSSARDWETNINELATGATPNTLKKVNQGLENKQANSALNSYQIDPIATLKQHINENQFIQYDKFVDDNLKKYQPKEYSFTGHSLGGGHSMRQGVRHNAKTVSFAGANSYRTLTPQQKKDVKAGKYDNKITNYRHYGDLVPNVPIDSKDGGQTIGQQIYVQSAVPNKSYKTLNFSPMSVPISTIEVGMNELNQHSTKNWSKKTFNSDGSIKKEDSKYSSFDPENLGPFDKTLALIYAKGTTDGEAIKISPDEVNAIASSLINLVEDDIDTTVNSINYNSEDEFIDNYRFIKQLADTLAPDLTKDEIEQCLADNDITYQTMVTDPTNSIKKKTKKLTKVGNELKEIADKATDASNQFVNTDSQIGGQFS